MGLARVCVCVCVVCKVVFVHGGERGRLSVIVSVRVRRSVDGQGRGRSLVVSLIGVW